MKLLSTISLFDHYMFAWCVERKHRDRIVFVSREFSRSADGPLYAVLALIFAFLSQWDLVKVLAVGVFIERILYFILKNFLKRMRPQQAISDFTSAIQPSDQFSFPSGHTSAAFLMTAILSAFFPLLFVPMLCWAVCVGYLHTKKTYRK